jgi:hypothetical protein
LQFAKALLVLSAPRGSASAKLVQRALDVKKPVFVPEHPMNKEMIATGARPATIDNIGQLFE